MPERKEGARKRQRVEFRVVCIDEKGTQLLWKHAKTFKDALRYLRNLDHKHQALCQWLIHEAQVTETTRTVYTLDNGKRARSS
jgi:hypothetical protein